MLTALLRKLAAALSIGAGNKEDPTEFSKSDGGIVIPLAQKKLFIKTLELLMRI